MSNNTEVKESVNRTNAGRQQEKKQTEQRYDLPELVNAAEKAFGVKKEMAYAALKTAKVTCASVTEAKGIINRFLKKEVK